MRHRFAVSLMALTICNVASIATLRAEDLSSQQVDGRRLVNQSCAVCHLTPQIGAKTYGPPLNRDSLGGQDSVLREVIGNGTPRMPGFRHQFKPAQIDAIIAFLKTVPSAPQPASASAAQR